MAERYWEIDSLRGIAIILMVAFHIFFDLNYLKAMDFNLSTFYWRILAVFTGSMFLFLVGVSLSISNAKALEQGKQTTKKFLRRGAIIFSLAMLVTLATWIYPHEGFIVFGILHLIGLSIILSIPFLKLGKENLFAGLAFIIAGYFLTQFRISGPWLLWLGVKPFGFVALDYYPLLPWFGVVLCGIFFGKVFYPKGKRKLRLGESKNKIAGFLSLLGRNSLKIYLAHQPVIVLLIFLLSYLKVI